MFTVVEDQHHGRCGQISGRFDAHATAGLRATIAATFLDAGGDTIVLDLSRVSFLDSVGLGAMVGLSKVARGRGGRLRLTGASEPVRKLLRLTALDAVFGDTMLDA